MPDCWGGGDAGCDIGLGQPPQLGPVRMAPGTLAVKELGNGVWDREVEAPLTSDLRELNIESRPGLVGIRWDWGLGCGASGEVGAEAAVRHC